MVKDDKILISWFIFLQFLNSTFVQKYMYLQSETDRQALVKYIIGVVELAAFYHWFSADYVSEYRSIQQQNKYLETEKKKESYILSSK